MTRSRQHGAALLVMLIILITGGAYLLVSQLNRASGRSEADRQTSEALAMAKEALIGRAASDDNRPGEMPCPDVDNDGQLTIGIDWGGGGVCTSLLGRLPWRTLDLPDLRDGHGERLWYAVSPDFRANAAAQLNSDRNGQITVRDPAGTVVLNGANQSAAIAVVFSPGPVITRQGAALPQDRSCVVGVNCDIAGMCTTTPPTLTPRCNPVSYLDIITGTEDNADFVAGSSANGFISGEIRDPADPSNLLVNDRISVIAHDDLFRTVELRIANDARNLLTAYAAACNSYPVPAPFTNPVTTATFDSGGGITEGLFPAGVALPFAWGIGCAPALPALFTETDINHWIHVMYYAIAPPPLPCTTCLTVINGPNPTNNKQAIIIMTGRAIVNSHPGPLTDYLEAQNQSTGDNVFQRAPLSPVFNDQVIIVP